jgi:leucyl aminopeptidase (aminopeptidase T)
MKMIEMMKYARIPIELNIEGVKEVAILTDTEIESKIPEALAAAAYELGLEPTVVIMIKRAVHGMEPTKVMAKALLGSDLMLFATSTGMAHTNAVREASKRGAKYIGMPHITIDTLCRGAATADYLEVQKITQQVAEILTNGKMVHITSKLGTDVIMEISGRKCHQLAGVWKPGSVACFPDGEVALAPLEETARGKIIIDSSMHQIGILKDPIIWEVKEGRVINIGGKIEASMLENILQKRGDENSRCVCELAVGTNPQARKSSNVSEDKKRLGSIHIAIGDNLTLGGEIHSSTHLDGVIENPTLYVDNRLLISDGNLQI